MRDDDRSWFTEPSKVDIETHIENMMTIRRVILAIAGEENLAEYAPLFDAELMQSLPFGQACLMSSGLYRMGPSWQLASMLDGVKVFDEMRALIEQFPGYTTIEGCLLGMWLKHVGKPGTSVLACMPIYQDNCIDMGLLLATVMHQYLFRSGVDGRVSNWALVKVERMMNAGKLKMIYRRDRLETKKPF